MCFWFFWLCLFNSPPARLGAHDDEIYEGTGEAVWILPRCRVDEPDDHQLGERVLALCQSLPALRVLINVFELWVLFLLVARFFRIRFDSNVPACVDFYPAGHGIHISFESRVLYLHTVVCVTPGEVVKVADRHDVLVG